MKLQEVFDQLAYGELSQISIGGQETGIINPKNQSRLIAHVNLGLTALYKRFPLKESSLVLDLVPDLEEYSLKRRYSISAEDSEEPVRYIQDTANSPFQEDILKIERVYAESGYEFSLNNLDDPYGLRTPVANVLQVPLDIVNQSLELDEELQTPTLKVVYRANHPLYTTELGEIEAEETELELPYTHLEPLLLFVASRVHTPIGLQGEGTGANVYMQKYEMACQELERLNLRVDQGSQRSRLIQRGFV
jgi:hypothetical protein